MKKQKKNVKNKNSKNDWATNLFIYFWTVRFARLGPVN